MSRAVWDTVSIQQLGRYWCLPANWDIFHTHWEHGIIYIAYIIHRVQPYAHFNAL